MVASLVGWKGKGKLCWFVRLLQSDLTDLVEYEMHHIALAGPVIAFALGFDAASNVDGPVIEPGRELSQDGHAFVVLLKNSCVGFWRYWHI